MYYPEPDFLVNQYFIYSNVLQFVTLKYYTAMKCEIIV